MARLKQILLGSAAAAAIACVPIAPALAGGGYGPLHPWGVGRGLVGAAVGLATLPLAIAAAVVTGGAASAGGAAVAPYPAPAYGGYGYGYGYAPRAVYPAPPVYGVPRAAYYPPVRNYYGPRPYYYAPRPSYAVHGYYRSGGYAYPHR
jgi:hypothetical protein